MLLKRGEADFFLVVLTHVEHWATKSDLINSALKHPVSTKGHAQRKKVVSSRASPHLEMLPLVSH